MNYLVTAIGSLAAEAVVSTLRKLPGARIVGCNCHPAAWVATSRLVDAFYETPHATDPTGFARALANICQAESIDRVIPLTDPEVDVLNNRRDMFDTGTTMLCIPSSQATRIIRDKWLAFRKFSHDPSVTLLPTQLLDDESPLSFPYPLIMKPALGRSSEGIVIAENAADFLHLRKKLQRKHYVVQPMLDGEVCVVDVVRQKSTERSATVARQELLRTPNGAGLTVEILPFGQLNKTAKHIAAILDINGCINIEFLLYQGSAMLMDINPRFSAGVVFSQLAGYDMVTNNIRCFESISIDPEIDPRSAIFTRRYTEVMTTSPGI